MKIQQNNDLKRGKRLPGNSVVVQLCRNGQFSVTIPKVMAMGMGLKKGSVVQYELLKQGGIKITNWKS